MVNAGFSLIEVLIAWVISTTIILGLVATQNESLRNIHHRYLQTLALASVQEMQERLLANSTIAARNRELALWNEENQYLLPSGKGLYNCQETTRICQITLTWQERDLQMVTITALI